MNLFRFLPLPPGSRFTRAGGWLVPLLAFLCWGHPVGAQVLTNGGFEAGLSPWASALSSGGAATFANTASNQHKGTNALLVTVSSPGSASNAVRIVSAPFTASSTNTYVLRFWATASVNFANLGVNLIGATPVFPQIPFKINTNSSGEYQEYLYAFKAAGSVAIAFNFQGAGQYWLDDVEILDEQNASGFDVPMTYLWQWGQWNFAQTNSLKIGWTGGDNNKSALLPDGSVAWIFNDTLSSPLNSFYSNIRGGSAMPRNALVHQIGTNLVWKNSGHNSMFVPEQVNDAQMPLTDDGGIYWIGGAIAESNKLFVLLNGLGYNGSYYTNVCMSVATLSLPNLTLDGVVTNLTSPGTDNFGDLVRGDDGFYYIYNAAKVARVPAGQMAMNAAWTYWNGSAWVADHTQNTAIANFKGWSISKLAPSNYVAVYIPTWSLDIYAQYAPTPMGPWGNDVLVASAPAEGGEGILSAYMPNICAGSLSNSLQTIGYSDNGVPSDFFQKVASDKSWYNPHYVTAGLRRLSPYNEGVGGPGSRLSIKFAADQNWNKNSIDNRYGAGVLNTTNWFNFGIGGGGSGVTNVPGYSLNGFNYKSQAKIVYNWASERTRSADNLTKPNNVNLLESWINVNNNCWYLSVTNLDSSFTNGYSVYFYYHGSAVGNGGRNFLRYFAGRTTNTPVLGTRQWNLYTTDAANNGTFIRDLTPANTSTTGETAGANYCVLTNLSGGAFDLLITNGNYGGVCAIEIVAHTLPAVGNVVATPSTNVYSDATVSLACPTNGGAGPFSVRWQAGADGVNWTNVTGATRTNLVLANFAPANAGYYRMIYTADTQSATSAVVRLNYYDTLPAISAVSAAPDNTVNQGASATLSCTTNGGAPPFGLQWQVAADGFSYTNVPAATGLSLLVSGAEAGDRGYYRCIFTAASLAVTSAPTHITVQPLAISLATVLPTNPVFTGQSAVLICSNFAGLGAYGFQWQASANGVTWTNISGANTNSLVLLGVTTNQAKYYQCVFTAANGTATSAPVQLKVLQAGGAPARLAIKFAPEQNYNHNFINLNWSTPSTRKPAGVLNTTNWNNWNTTGFSAPYRTNGLFYDRKGVTSVSSATILDYHSGEQVIYYNGNWPAAWFTNNNQLLLNSTFWYFGDQVACVVTNLDPVFATNGYSVYIYYLGSGIGQGQQYCLANYTGATTNSAITNRQICSLFTTTNWNNFNNGTYFTNLPPFLQGTAIFTPGVQTTATVHGSYPAWETPGANYVVFSNCPPSGALSIAVSNTFYAGICGIEIAANVPGSDLLATASTLGASTNLVYPGATVTFTNTVSPAPPDGEYVIFMDGPSVLGLGTLNNGQAVCTAAILASGSHNHTAVYGGNGNYLASTSSVATVSAVASPTLSAPVALPSANVYAGMTVTVVCSNYTGTPPYSFQWQASASGLNVTNIPGATTNWLTLLGVQAGNAGQYQLVFTAAGLSVTSSVLPLLVNPAATVAVQPAGGSLVLTWPAGVLLQATNLSGPWTTNAATSPFTNQPENPQMFYRVRLQ